MFASHYLFSKICVFSFADIHGRLKKRRFSEKFRETQDTFWATSGPHDEMNHTAKEGANLPTHVRSPVLRDLGQPSSIDPDKEK